MSGGMSCLLLDSRAVVVVAGVVLVVLVVVVRVVVDVDVLLLVVEVVDLRVVEETASGGPRVISGLKETPTSGTLALAAESDETELDGLTGSASSGVLMEGVVARVPCIWCWTSASAAYRRLMRSSRDSLGGTGP